MVKRYSLILLAVLLLVGCQATKKAMSNYDACKADPACLAQMQKAGDFAEDVVGKSLSFPYGEAVAVGIGGLASMLAGVVLGSRIKKG